MGYELRVASCELRVAGWELWVAGWELQAKRAKGIGQRAYRRVRKSECGMRKKDFELRCVVD